MPSIDIKNLKEAGWLPQLLLALYKATDYSGNYQRHQPRGAQTYKGQALTSRYGDDLAEERAFHDAVASAERFSRHRAPTLLDAQATIAANPKLEFRKVDLGLGERDLHVDFSRNEFDPLMYDSYHGEGKALTILIGPDGLSGLKMKLREHVRAKDTADTDCWIPWEGLISVAEDDVRENEAAASRAEAAAEAASAAAEALAVKAAEERARAVLARGLAQEAKAEIARLKAAEAASVVAAQAARSAARAKAPAA